MYRKVAMLVGALMLADPVIAENSEEAIGQFASQGYVGPYANQKNMAEAHAACLGQSSNGALGSNAVDSDYYNHYKSCMAQYVPFKETGAGTGGSCPSTDVQWGQCGARLGAAPGGATMTARNALLTEDYEGFAAFQCNGGEWEFQGGGCSRAVHACEADQLVSWGVTEPLWADEDPRTIYRDQYGELRHTPKERCLANMPYSLSGELHQPTPTVPEMVAPERYIMSDTAPFRCFDNGWLHEPGSGTSDCTYVPKSCEAMAYEYNGCGYSLPAVEHDTVFVAKNPTPALSMGTVEAYCWDGTWEIKGQSCQLSCGIDLGDLSWSGSDPRSCYHAPVSSGTRIAPGSHTLVNNEVAGMDGNVSYRCDNGQWTKSAQFCEPQGCDSLDGQSWGNGDLCRHDAVSGKTWQHGDSYVVDSQTGFFDANGRITYRCEYGEMVIKGTPVCERITTNVCFSQDAIAEGDADGSAGGGSVDYDFCDIFGNRAVQMGELCCIPTKSGSDSICYEQP